MTTFTWTPNPSGTYTWTDPANWGPTTPTSNDFANITNDFVIAPNGNPNQTINGFGAGNAVNSLTINNSHAILNFGTGQIQVASALNLQSGTINAAAPTGGNILLGTSVSVGTLTINGLFEGGGTSAFYTIKGGATSLGSVTGTGTVLANTGFIDFNSGVTVATGTSLQFDIAAGVDGIRFDNIVNSGTVQYLGTQGYLIAAGTMVTSGTTALVNGGTFGAPIVGMNASSAISTAIDIPINVTKVASANLSNQTASSSVLQVFDTLGHVYNFTLLGNYFGDAVSFAKDTLLGGTDFWVTCFTPGTAIDTPDGTAPVETIQAGDQIVAIEDGNRVVRTVKWVGHRHLDMSRHPNPDAIAPVRIAAGALGDGLPHRDLVLSPDHCLFIDGGLYPAKLLVNDMTILRDVAMTEVTYHHVELDQHGIVLAEGVEAESYLDTGNRAFFSNAGLATILHPELTINERLQAWDTDACAPLIVKPEAVEPVWRRFAKRARALGHVAPDHAVTSDSGLHLLVDGKRLRPVSTGPDAVTFMLPGGARSVRLISRATAPNRLARWVDDTRSLGIAVRSLTLRDRDGETVLGADHPSLRDGWHTPERADDGALWRWSTGDATLPVRSSGPCTVEIALGGATRYIERLAA